MKILFADDDSKIHVIVKLWLGRNGHDVLTARNGQEALAQLEKGGFDGLITDVNMPLMNGVELVKQSLQLSDPPELIVVMTSRCDIPQLQHQINSERVHLFSKPFSPRALAKLIEKLSIEQTA